jgi:polyhydroxyalkanoate synthesis regulator phasin
MKSLIMKSVYAGLGVLNSGKQSIEHLGRELAKQADLSEKDGQQIARRLRARTDRAITTLHKAIQTEIKTAVDALHTAAKDDVEELSGKRRRPAAKRRAR